MDEQSIFLAALDKPTPESRAAFIDEACAGDETLRRNVELLLRAHERAGDFLVGTPAGFEATEILPVTEKAGDTIGPYKLLQQIGHGGMGVVYLAEQSEPVRRRVALKIIKPGMDTRQVIARFEAERQALAMMDHPHIAKVLDAGTTDTGRPYFVMELVKGIPITRYCDEHQLPPRERLELFAAICLAVQHSHQKGIIHRDIKPSNILVASCDGKAVAKVIDFGLAKATGRQLTDKTMFTQYGQIVGTMEYMSPEQAQLDSMDVDTRTDIYSLGVLLYELLTGETPFDKKRLRSVAFNELLRIIREEDPPRPSVRLSSSEALPSIAANRHIEPKKLSTLMNGELDWIVMKALEKDRSRRYETASGFAADLQRYLSDEPVDACPPSAAYRFRKFARRNKIALRTIATVGLVLVIGMCTTTWQAFRATSAERDAQSLLEDERQARQEADEARSAESLQRKVAEVARDEARMEAVRANTVIEVLTGLFASGDPDSELGKPAEYTVRQFLIDASERLPAQLRSQPAVEAEVRSVLGRALAALDLFYEANEQLATAKQLNRQIHGEQHPKYVESLLDCYDLHYAGISRAAKADLARQAYQLCLSIPDQVECRLRSAVAMLESAPPQDRLEFARQAIHYADEHGGSESPYTARILMLYAQAELERASAANEGQGADHHREAIRHAESLARRAVNVYRQLYGEEHPRTAKSIRLMGQIKLAQGDASEAATLFRRALATAIRFDIYYEPRNLLNDLRPIVSEDEFERLESSCENLADAPYFRCIEGVDYLNRGDLENYRQTCLSLVANYREPQLTLNIAFLCMLHENAVDDWSPVIALASSDQSLNRSFSLLGPVLYRAGRIQDAIDALNTMEQYYAQHDGEFDDLINAYRCYTRIFLAMSHFRAGDQQAALQWYEKSRSDVARIVDRDEAFWGQWHQSSLSLLMKEAAQLLNSAQTSD